MLIKETDKKRQKKRRRLRKRKAPLEKEEKAILSPVNLPVKEHIAPPSEEVPSIWDRMFRFLVGEFKSADEQRLLSPAMDPMRTILAIPDGIGRLEAFKEMLEQTPHESFYYRSIALSFRRHLMDMLEEAQLPPASIEHHLTPCIEALQIAGLEADAQLLKDLPPYDPYIPKQIFLSANERGELDAVDEEIAFSAKTAFRDFEIEMLRNNRDLAFAHLTKAIQSAPGHPKYQSSFDNFNSKKPLPFMIDLENESQSLRLCSGQQFVWGRAEDAALVHRDPQVSREHAVFSYLGQRQWALTQREKSLPIMFGEQVWEDGLLPSQGTLSLNRQTINFEISSNGIAITILSNPTHLLLLSANEQIPIPWQANEQLMPLNILFHRNGFAYLIPTQHTFFNSEEVKKKIRLLIGDTFSNATQSWAVKRQK